MIKLENVSFVYDSDERAAGVYNVSLNIAKGEVLVLCGESGCGKTTITRLINGLVPGYYKGKLSGEVTVNGIKLSENAMNELSEHVGSVFQNPKTQFFNIDSTGEIAFACENFGIEQEEIYRRIGRVSADLEIRDLLDRNLFSMSGGEKQKIACASAAAMEPKIFVLDEPSSNLDLRTIGTLKKTIGKWKAQGATIVIAEHRLEYLQELTDRFIYMKNGKIEKEFLKEDFQSLSNRELNQMGLRNLSPVEFDNIMIEEKLNSENFIIENLKFSYNQKEFLDIPSLELPQHGIIGVIGFNGSGKSTFSNCMCGLVKKAKGTLLYGNQIFGAKERIKKCFMVMQDVNHQLFTDSVKEEIAISINDDEEGAESRICEIGKRLHLEAFMELHPMSLSGGEKQRVAIASAIAADRDILILDEPTSGLDYRHMMEVSNELKRLSKIGKTIFVITHDPELINLSCNYFIFLDKGKVKWYGGRTKEILSKVENFFRDGEN